MVLTRLGRPPLLALAAASVAVLHLVPVPQHAWRGRPGVAVGPPAPTRAALGPAHTERRRGALGAAEASYASLATDPRAPLTLREEARYWSLHVRLAAGDPLARAALESFIVRARSPDLALRAAGLACTFARDPTERGRASALAHDALRTRAEVATEDGARWRAALAKLAERAESTRDFFVEKSGKPLHSGSDCP